MALRIGYKASAEQFGPRDLVEYAVRAEEVGLDSVWVSDHFLPWRHEGGHAPSALTWMAAVGERTRRVQIGTSVTTPTFRYNPAVMAQTFATMALLYDDRVILGAGTGEALNEIAVSGREWPELGLSTKSIAANGRRQRPTRSPRSAVELLQRSRAKRLWSEDAGHSIVSWASARITLATVCRLSWRSMASVFAHHSLVTSPSVVSVAIVDSSSAASPGSNTPSARSTRLRSSGFGVQGVSRVSLEEPPRVRRSRTSLWRSWSALRLSLRAVP